jgi:hypothetical protein
LHQSINQSSPCAVDCINPLTNHPLAQSIALDINEAQREKEQFEASVARVEGIPKAYAQGKFGAIMLEAEATEHDGYKHKVCNGADTDPREGDCENVMANIFFNSASGLREF